MFSTHMPEASLFICMEKIMLLDAVKKMMDIVEIQDSRDPKKVRYPLGPTLFAIMLAWMCGKRKSNPRYLRDCRTVLL